MRYYLIAGEASGDLHASNLMRSLLSHDATAEFRFYGGDKMESVGGTLVKHYREMSYMGFVPVLPHARTILRNMKDCKADILSWQPDVVILVDYPGFNLSIAKYVKRHSEIPVYYYISPKIWAWKEHRIKSIRKYVDELFSILPFEVDFFEQKHHYPIHYVGNPCVDAIEAYHNELRSEGLKSVNRDDRQVAIVAGSRIQEIRKNLGIMLESVRDIVGLKPVITGAPNIGMDVYLKYIPKGMDVEVVFDHTYEIIESSSAALVTSGTATLETALLGTPQVVCYHMSGGWLVKFFRRLLLKVKYISLVNLICDKEAVRELVGGEMNTENVKSELKSILPGGSRRDEMLSDYKMLAEKTGPSGASERAGGLIVEALKAQHS
jgi:lipid-A-disaccharide synthase